MNRTGKTNAKKGPDKDYNAFRDFHDREVEAHIIASFLTHIGAPNLEGSLINFYIYIYNLLKRGSFENEDQNTKHPNLENEAPKSQKESTQ